MRRLLSLLVAIGVVASCGANGAFVRETQAWREQRRAELLQPDGWITLVGLHFLKPGVSTIGSAKENAVVLAKGPQRLGKVEVAPDGTVWLDVAQSVEAAVDGRKVQRVELKPAAGARKATTVTIGTVSLFAMEPNGRKAIRVRDSASERRTEFAGLEYFPADPTWRIEARWEAFEKSRMIPVTDVLGQTSPALIPGKAVFERDGKRYELLPIDEGRDKPLFFVISDSTSGKETYGACRFIYVPWPKGDGIVLDFNRAENPPCAFTPFAMCPLPPKENRLPFAVRAGEKTYRGKHD
jgi:uncharacterized protein (DUF1684 family)